MATSSQGRYVPPHLRKQNVSQPPADGPNAGPSRSSYTGGSANGPRGDSSDDRSSTARGSSRTPWAAPNHPQDHPEVYKGRSRDLLGPRDGPSGWGPRRTSHSAPPPEGARRRQDNDLRTSIAPTLYVFGDSFTGPLKLLSDDCCRVQSYKGASAKVNRRTTSRTVPDEIAGIKQPEVRQASFTSSSSSFGSSTGTATLRLHAISGTLGATDLRKRELT